MKVLPFLLILTLPSTCTSDEGAENNAANHIPQDSLATWTMRSPPHIVDLAMWFYPPSDSMAWITWEDLQAKDGPVKWKQRSPKKHKFPNGKEAWSLEGTCNIALKQEHGAPPMAKAYVRVQGGAIGPRYLDIESGYDREWGGRYFEPSLWMDVDTSRYKLVEQYDNETDGKTFSYSYELDLPQRKRLRVGSGNSCGTWGCNYMISFGFDEELNAAR